METRIHICLYTLVRSIATRYFPSLAFLVPPQTGDPDVVDRLKHGLPPLETVHNRQAPLRRVDHLTTASMVFIRNDHASKPTMAPLYSGPFEVVDRCESQYDVKIGDKVEAINIHCLKPAQTDVNITPAIPPRRG